MKKKLLLHLGIVVTCMLIAFYGGVKFNEFRYDDICLDMGGGKNPGNYPICVVTEKNLEERITQ